MQRNINPHFLRYWVLCLWQQKTVNFGKSFSIPLIWLSYSNLTLLKDPYNQSICSSNIFKKTVKIQKKDDDNDADSILVSDTGNTELMYCAASEGSASYLQLLLLLLVQNIHSENMLIASCVMSFPYSFLNFEQFNTFNKYGSNKQ